MPETAAPPPVPSRALTVEERIDLARMLGRIEGKIDAAIIRQAAQ
ncbi:hypothetical protein AB0L86_04890 [Micromonospora musae]